MNDLTPEDVAAVTRGAYMPSSHPEFKACLRRLDIVAAMAQGDERDARAMLAIEVRKEREYRINAPTYAHPSTPADRVYLYGDTALRLEVEAINGEPLL